MLPIETILHATDFSEHSEHAFRLACSLARDFGARLLVLHIGKEPVISPISGVVPSEPEHYQEQLTARLHRMQQEFPELHVEAFLFFGADPAQKILEAIQGSECDLVVLGTHGREGLSRAWHGSVAEEVIHKAACPVLTLRAPEHPADTAQEAVPLVVAGSTLTCR